MAEFKKPTFDALTVGKEFVSDTHLITPEDVDTYAYAVDDHHPWFFGPSPFGGPVAHPMLMANQALHLRHGATSCTRACTRGWSSTSCSRSSSACAFARVIDKYRRCGKPCRTVPGGRPVCTRALDVEGELARRGIPSRRRPTSPRPHDV